MSYSFKARFDSTSLQLDQACDALDEIFRSNEITFQRSVTRLVSHNGWPTVDLKSLRGESDYFGAQVSELGDVPSMAKGWWGVSFFCVSQKLARHLGRSDAMEVDFQLYRASVGRWSLMYTEASRAHDYRIRDDAAAKEMYGLQLSICEKFGFDFSVYDEEDFRLSPTPTLNEVESQLHRVKQGELGSSMVVAETHMSLDRARELCGTRASEVRQATTGHILLPFLHE